MFQCTVSVLTGARQIGIVVISIWTPLVKASTTSGIIPEQQRHQLLCELMRIGIDRFLARRVSSPDDLSDKDDVESQRLYQRLRTCLLDLVRAITGQAPLQALQLVCPHIVRLLNTPPTDHLNAAGHATSQTSTVVQLQAACSLLACILDCSSVRSSDPELTSALQSLLVSVLSATLTDSQLLIRQAACLVLFHDLVGQTPQALKAVVDKLLWMSGFTSSGPGGEDDRPGMMSSADTIAHQRKAVQCLTTLARKPHCAAILLQWFQELAPTMLSLCRSMPIHAPSILECLVAICNALPSSLERTQYVVQLIRNELAEFVALDPAQLIKIFGFSQSRPLDINVDEVVALRADRRHVIRILNTIQPVFRSITIPLGDAEAQHVLWTTISSIMPNIAHIISYVHSLFSSCDLTPTARASLEPWGQECEHLTSQLYGADRSDQKEAFESIRTQLYTIRDQCYLLISSSFSCPYMYSNGDHILALIVSTCLSDACLGQGPQAIHQTRVNAVVSKVWVAFLEKCPISHPRFISIFSRIVTSLFGRLSQQWSAIFEGTLSVSVDREVFEENTLREGTRSLMQVMQTALSPHNWVAFTDTHQQQLTRQDSACGVVSDDPILLSVVLNALQMAIQVPDSVTQVRAAGLIARLLPYSASLKHCFEIYMKILETCLRMISNMTKTFASSSGPGQDLIGVCYEILKQFASVDRGPFTLLLRHPLVVKEEAEALYETLRSSPQSTKATRTATRTFILAYIPQGDDSRKTLIRDLPGRLVVSEKESAPRSRDPSPDKQLPQLFP